MRISQKCIGIRRNSSVTSIEAPSSNNCRQGREMRFEERPGKRRRGKRDTDPPHAMSTVSAWDAKLKSRSSAPGAAAELLVLGCFFFLFSHFFSFFFLYLKMAWPCLNLEPRSSALSYTVIHATNSSNAEDGRGSRVQAQVALYRIALYCTLEPHFHRSVSEGARKESPQSECKRKV